MSRPSKVPVVLGGALLLAGAIMLVVLPGCNGPDIVAAQQQAADVQAQYTAAKEAAEKDRIAAEAAAAKARDEMERAKTERARKVAEDALAQAEANGKRASEAEGIAQKAIDALTAATKIIEDSKGPNGEIDPGKAAGSVGAMLPPPWNGVAVLGGPLIAWVVQEIRRRKAEQAAVSIINGISAVAASDPSLRTTLDRGQPLLMAEYTPAAKKLVKKHTLAKPRNGSPDKAVA